MKYDLMKAIAPYMIWDPKEEGLEPHVEIDQKKVWKAFEHHFKGTEWAKKFTDATGDTLYMSMKHMPLANMYIYINEGLTENDLLELFKEGKKENGMYRYSMDDCKEYVEAVRTVQQEVYDMYQSGSYAFDFSKCTFELPGAGERAALNKILESVSMPPIEELTNLAKDAGGQIKAAQEEAAAQAKVAEGLSSDMARLKEQLKEYALKAETTAIPELKVQSDGTIPDGELVYKKASELFPSVQLPVDLELPCFEWDGVHPDVPEVDPHYIFRPRELGRALYALVTNKRGYFHGHTGSGKTTLLEQVAAHLSFPFVRINFDSEITRMDLIGRDVLSTDDNGNTVSHFEEGMLPRAMSGPCICCFDELDFVRPDVAYVMQAATEGNGLRITEDGDRMVQPHPMFRMFATGNTVGQGDEEGMYQGARPQSMAFLDRFTVWCRVDYLDKTQREELVKRHYPTLSEEEMRILSQYTEEHLEAFTGGKVHQPITPRGMLSIAQSIAILGDVKDALSMTVLDRSSNEDRAVLHGLVDRVTS